MLPIKFHGYKNALYYTFNEVLTLLHDEAILEISPDILVLMP
jgi:hypothetical protein